MINRCPTKRGRRTEYYANCIMSPKYDAEYYVVVLKGRERKESLHIYKPWRIGKNWEVYNTKNLTNWGLVDTK